ncbi:MAG: hypothetical protein QXV17_13130 [Candidatus Micrarchaeaceae archaeon]
MNLMPLPVNMYSIQSCDPNMKLNGTPLGTIYLNLTEGRAWNKYALLSKVGTVPYYETPDGKYYAILDNRCYLIQTTPFSTGITWGFGVVNQSTTPSSELYKMFSVPPPTSTATSSTSSTTSTIPNKSTTSANSTISSNSLKSKISSINKTINSTIPSKTTNKNITVHSPIPRTLTNIANPPSVHSKSLESIAPITHKNIQPIATIKEINNPLINLLTTIINDIESFITKLFR